MSASPKPRAPRLQVQEDEDDDLAELPDLDGESEEDEGAAREDAGDLGDLGDEATSDLDDATGEERDVFGQNDVDLDAEGSFLEDAEPAGDVDLELPEIPGSTVSLLDDKEPKPEPDDDFELDTNDAGPLDAGEEGPTDADEELKDADLPALDADDEGEVDEATLYDVALEEDAPIPWGDERWVAAGTPVECGEVVALVSDPLGGLARLADGALVRLDLEGGARRISSPPGHIDAATQEHEEVAHRALVDRWAKELARVEVVASARDDRGGAFLVVASLAEPRVWLARAGIDEAPRLVAELDATLASDVRDLGWDEARGVVWLAGAFGARALHAAAAAVPSHAPS